MCFCLLLSPGCTTQDCLFANPHPSFVPQEYFPRTLRLPGEDHIYAAARVSSHSVAIAGCSDVVRRYYRLQLGLLVVYDRSGATVRRRGECSETTPTIGEAAPRTDPSLMSDV